MRATFATLLMLAALAGCSARKLSAVAPAADRIPLTRLTAQGIAPFLQSNSNYSLFTGLVGFDSQFGPLLRTVWSQGVTNNTVLVATDDAVIDGLEQLQNVYGIPGNVSTLLEVAQTSAAATQAVKTVVSAILSSHILTTPINFYANNTILNATLEDPITLPASNLTELASPVAYNEPNGTVDNIQVIQPTGLLTTAVDIPKLYANQLGVNTRLGGGPASLYLYEVSSILVASEVADASVLDALNTIREAS